MKFLLCTFTTYFLVLGSVSASSMDDCKPSIAAVNSGNYLPAFRLWKKMAYQGILKEQIREARECLRVGKIVTTHHGYVDWIKLRANENLPVAQGQLGLIFYFGWGVTKGEQLGISWLERASNAGHPESAHTLGVLLACGSENTRNNTKAMELLQKAIDLGDSEASRTKEQLLIGQKSVGDDGRPPCKYVSPKHS